MWTASIGIPKGLTRNAVTHQIIPSRGATVMNAIAPRITRRIEARPNTHDVHHRMPQHIHVSGVRTITIGRARLFKSSFNSFIMANLLRQSQRTPGTTIVQGCQAKT